MTCIRSSKVIRAITAFLIAAVVLPLAPLGIRPCQAQVDGVQKVVLFPVLDNTGAGLADLSRLATNKLQLAINEAEQVRCTEFDSTSPIIRRAISEGRLLPVYAQAAPTEPVDAIRIGHMLGVDAVILASVEVLEILHQPRQVTVTIRGQYFLVEPNFDPATDEPVATPVAQQSFTIGGTSTVRARYEGSNRPLIREALDDAAYKFKEIIAGRSVAEIVAEAARPQKKKSTWKKLAPVLILAALALLLSNKGNETVTTPAGAVPPTPLSLRVESNAIRLFWNPPLATDLILLRYHISRSVDHGATWQYIDQGNCDATRTSWPDFNVSEGNVYQYRIRSVYTSQAVSIWAMFSQITFTRN